MCDLLSELPWVSHPRSEEDDPDLPLPWAWAAAVRGDTDDSSPVSCQVLVVGGYGPDAKVHSKAAEKTFVGIRIEVCGFPGKLASKWLPQNKSGSLRGLRH